MTETATDTLLRRAARALERMAFVFTEPGEETPGEVLARRILSARLEITAEEQDGGEAWELCVVGTFDFLSEVTAAMLGLEVEDIDIEEHGPATVSELANVLGGELVMAVGGEESSLRLGLPEVIGDERAGELIDRCSDEGSRFVLETETGASLLVGWTRP